MFALTFILGGFLHVTGPQYAAPQVPALFGAPTFWVYFTGVAQFAFSGSILLGRWDRLASFCLFAMMVVFIATIHIPKAAAGDFMGVTSIMRDFGYAGAALVYAGAMAKDTRMRPFEAHAAKSGAT
jgi:uncharacterized membrane protein YphA (DoxX/SURF4 family)